MDISGLSAVITGGASGLGEATARMLTAAGGKVALFDMNAEKGEALAAELSGVFVSVDVSDPASPSVLGSFPSWGAATSVDPTRSLIYFADDAAGLVIIRPTGPGQGDDSEDSEDDE